MHSGIAGARIVSRKSRDTSRNDERVFFPHISHTRTMTFGGNVIHSPSLLGAGNVGGGNPKNTGLKKPKPV